MCLVVEYKGKTIKICSKSAAKKEADSVDVTDLIEISDWGVPHSDSAKVAAHVETLKTMRAPVVNCASGVHRSVVVAILFLADATQTSVQAAYDTVKAASGGVLNKMVYESLKTLGHNLDR